LLTPLPYTCPVAIGSTINEHQAQKPSFAPLPLQSAAIVPFHSTPVRYFPLHFVHLGFRAFSCNFEMLRQIQELRQLSTCQLVRSFNCKSHPPQSVFLVPTISFPSQTKQYSVLVTKNETSKQGNFPPTHGKVKASGF
jgi:hypothetical protein